MLGGRHRPRDYRTAQTASHSRGKATMPFARSFVRTNVWKLSLMSWSSMNRTGPCRSPPARWSLLGPSRRSAARPRSAGRTHARRARLRPRRPRRPTPCGDRPRRASRRLPDAHCEGQSTYPSSEERRRLEVAVPTDCELANVVCGEAILRDDGQQQGSGGEERQPHDGHRGEQAESARLLVAS
jgi:hypothetical protein